MAGDVNDEKGLAGTFWSALGPADRDAFTGVAAIRQFEVGDELVSEGDRSRTVYVLGRGRVKVTSTAVGGHSAVLSVRGPGDIVGEMAAIDGGLRSATITAIDRVHAYAVAADSFALLLSVRPEISAAVLRIMVARFRYANVRRAEFGDTSAMSRVTQLLLDFAERFGVHRGADVLIAIRLTQTDLAGAVAASREAVARALRELRLRGLVETSRQQIVVHDLPALRDFATQLKRS